MTDAQKEAISQANAYLNNAGLPTYSKLVSAAQEFTFDGTPDKECSPVEMRLRSLLYRMG